jgi:hypothetical protein
MNEVKEAEALPDRHVYADEHDTDDGDLDYSPDVEDIALEREFSGQVTFKDFLRKIVKSSKVFGELVLIRTGDKRLDRHLRNLRMIKSAQTYGFLMHLKVGGVDDKVFLQILKLTENFVLRRHVCRERSNETETLFAKLCAVNPTDPLSDVRKAYREACPSDEKFRLEFTTANFTANIIDRARYCLEQIEIDSHGKHNELQVLDSSDVHVEHIIPQKIKTNKAKDEFGDWVSYIGDKVEILHPKMVSRIGNLILFAGALNIGASNNPFSNKKKAYRSSSIIITRDLAEMPVFRFNQVELRSRKLAALAVARWPTP